MLYKKRNSRIHKKIRRFIIIVCSLIILFTVLFEMQAVPFTQKCLKKQSETISTKIIGKSVTEVLKKMKIKYEDLAHINYSDKGQVNSISADTVNINKIKAEAADCIQKELDKNKVYSFSLPLGAFTDITLLSTLGPDISISFALSGSVNCKIKSTFESGGVNQTIHHIKLIVKTKIISISPEYSEETVFKTDYEIAQTVIVGEIPETYADIVR